jgi:thiamine-phosphate pyrophosphorylase
MLRSMIDSTVLKIARLLNSRGGFKLLPPLIYMTDEIRTPNPRPVIEKLKPGTGVIFRHYQFSERAGLGLEIKKLCKRKGLLFLVGGDYELAQMLDADGFHLPEYMVSNPSFNIRVWGQKKNKILTAAAHTKKSLLKCQSLGVDAALVSPVFTTKSHSDSTTIGVLGLHKIAQNTSLPIYALGGINNGNAQQLLKSSVIGIAGIGLFPSIY